MKKKLCTILLAVAMISTVFTGCGTSDSTDDASSTGDVTTESISENDSDFDTTQEITVVSREDGSGTRGAFVELLGIEQADENGDKVDMTTDEANVTNSTSVMMTTVAGDETAIGYISLGSLNDTVKAIKVDGVEATTDNVKDGSYAVSRPFNIATLGEPENEVAVDFINFIMSAEGQAIVTENGYITVDDDAAAFESTNPSGKLTIGGSTSVTPVMEKLVEAYEEINADADIEIQTSDSTTGMTNAADGTYDVGMASRELKDSETEAGLVSTTIAMDGIAVIVNNNNPIDDLTSEQIMNIYIGETLTWDEIE